MTSTKSRVYPLQKKSSSGSVLVTLRGHAHTAYRSGARCVNEAVDAYLLEGRLPAADVECGTADDGGS
ncbi:alpha/beta hydrolase [Nonomuraea coxensis]|uniref:alpha/beta hydrolase n=1 Tax=Nonomuraea coxensis TaxID=404386 RepID=UPI001FE40561|nr:alpha/beta hydrolase [Nonomuraea coxensis]